MNVRIYKKKAKRAKELLIRDHGLKDRDFDAVERGDEFGYELFGEFDGRDPLKGTPIIITQVYGCSDTDAHCVVDRLHEVIFWSVSDRQIQRRTAS